MTTIDGDMLFLALAAATLDDGARGQGVEPAAHSASVIDGLSLLL